MNDFAPIAKVITDSVSTETGHRLTTLELTLHPHTLTQLLSHRAFSRTLNLNPAISFAATTRAMNNNPVYPALWAKDQGAHAGTPLHHTKVDRARQSWDEARTAAHAYAEQLSELGVHRSIINRLLTPFTVVTGLVTATDWTDFFDQRLVIPDALDPLVDTEITGLAYAMRDALAASEPEKLDIGHWHLPYLDDFETRHMEMTTAVHTSAARCANGPSTDPLANRDTYRRLFQGIPPHWSPLEHLATPAATTEKTNGNLTGWHQLRHLNPGRFA